jgi:UDP-N-acetylmuramoylalanine--D-glutamate ligase
MDHMEEKDPTSPLRLAGGQLVDARRAGLATQGSGPHRMELVATINGVDYINDSRSTFLDAALESLGRMSTKVVWIVGDVSAEMDEGYVQDLLMEKVSAMVLFGRAIDAVEREGASPVQHLYVTDDLRTAVFLANELVLPEGAVLFSPACPSGNGFANYEERGAEFKRAVRDL